MLVYATARWIRGLGAGRGVVENSDYGVGRAVDNDPVESKVLEMVSGDAKVARVQQDCARRSLWSKKRIRLPRGMSSERPFG